MTMYPHWLTIMQPGEGGMRDANDVWQPAPATAVFDGPADVQDQGAVLRRDLSGVPVLQSDARAYLSNRRSLSRIKPGQPATIRWEDKTTADAEVVQVERMSALVYLRFL